MMNNKEKALATLNEGFSCAQSVFSAYCEDFGIDRTTGLRIAGTFGGGICNRGETCGAVSAAVMLVGLKCGRVVASDLEAKAYSYGLSNQVIDRFMEKYGCFKCKELLGYDISTEEGANMASEKNLFKTLCPGFVASACDIIDALLYDKGEQRNEK